VVKKGEHGAMLVTPDMVFFAPGYPLEEVLDPTGAGDAFAGGMVGWLAFVDRMSRDELRRGIVYGSALGSFAAEGFGADRLRNLTIDEIHERVRIFRRLTAFEHELPSHV